MKFAEVILPLALNKPYTYRVPDFLENRLKPGMRVSVQFGKRKLYTALVWRLHEDAPIGYEPKPILDDFDEAPILIPSQIEVWNWMAKYYLSPLGLVMQAALPSVFKLQSETVIIRNEDAPEIDSDSLSDEAFLLQEALQFRSEISIDEASKIVDRKRVMPIVRELIEADLASLKEELSNEYRPVKETFVKLVPKTDAEMKSAFELVKRAPKQSALLLNLVHLLRRKPNLTKKEWLSSSEGTSAQAKELEKKELIVLEERVMDPFAGKDEEVLERNLSENQEFALTQIQAGFAENKPVLLKGVTGSGKTLVYMDLIQDALNAGKDVLYLLPEIALTTQIIQRLNHVFPGKVLVYHSRYSGNERARVWNHLLNSKRSGKLVVGARSSIFLPFAQLGLIVVDEEHDSSFKQYDPAPRYQARDVAIWMAHKMKSKIILGTATPALESHHNAELGKYHLVEMKERFGGSVMPSISLIDVKEAHKRRQMKAMFSPELLEALRENKARGKQAILFQNRRGFSPMLECQTCGAVPQCRNCDISLTYHKGFNKLRCHYCGYQAPLPSSCVACESTEISTKGFGTEQIVEELQLLEPDWKLARMDLDTTRGKKAHAQMLYDFEQGEIDVLVGTQMVTKGLDFDHVGLVGVLNADNMLNFPEYRAHERGFQLLMQVAGRAGRKLDPGKVLIQTFDPNHRVLRHVITYRQEEMYAYLIQDRKQFFYPPFNRMVAITLKHKTPQTVNSAAQILANALREELGNRILGPAIPGVYRLRNLFQQQILIKLTKGPQITAEKNFIQAQCNRLDQVAEYRSVRVGIDVDP